MHAFAKCASYEVPPNHQKGTVKNTPQFLYAQLIPHEGEKKNTIEETIKISATPPHQMGHMLGDQGESKKQSTPPVEKQKGCVCIGMAKGAQMEVAKRI